MKNICERTENSNQFERFTGQNCNWKPLNKGKVCNEYQSHQPAKNTFYLISYKTKIVLKYAHPCTDTEALYRPYGP